MLEIVMSLVAAVARADSCKVATGRYLGSKQLTILVVRNNPAKLEVRYSSSLVMTSMPGVVSPGTKIVN